ncbi:MAG: family 43 glycosylhydrolase [Verrucomicrobiales bacterium]
MNLTLHSQAPLRNDNANESRLATSLASLQDRGARALSLTGTFMNPIIPPPSADPWVIYHNGFYYYCESRNQDSIHVRKAKSFTEFGLDAGLEVWNAPVFGGNSKAVWAPELHLLDGKWYIYYAADDGLNENHRMWVLEGLTDDPQGPYRCRGVLDTQGWAIDGTVLTMDDGQMYYLWSGWPGNVNGRQNIYIAPMSNPYTISGPRVLIAEPEEAWETIDMAICEGPQILKQNGKVFLVYSASGSWTVDYCLGMLQLKGADPLDRANWEKAGCVFQKSKRVWGVGHCSFVKSPDGMEDWIIYHAKTKVKKGWNDRNVHAQRFTWTEDGIPVFGSPIPSGVPIQNPSAMENPVFSVPVGL